MFEGVRVIEGLECKVRFKRGALDSDVGHLQALLPSRRWRLASWVGPLEHQTAGSLDAPTADTAGKHYFTRLPIGNSSADAMILFALLTSRSRRHQLELRVDC